MNDCSFIGRMGANPKFYQGDQNKKSTLMFSLAVKKDFQVQQGQADCDWLDFKAFGKQAELINQYVQKGQQIGIVAKATVEKWKDQNGNDRQAVKFIVSNITFVGSGNGNSNNGNSSSNSNNNSNNSNTGFTPTNLDDDDDLPF